MIVHGTRHKCKRLKAKSHLFPYLLIPSAKVECTTQNKDVYPQPNINRTHLANYLEN